MNKFDITAIEEAVQTMLRNASVSDKIYTSRPSASTTTANDFVVAKVVGNLEDVACYGRCTISVALFAKDVNGQKNAKKLSVMYGKMIDGFQVENGSAVLDGNPTVLGDTPDDYGYHARMINIKTTIKI